MWLITLISLIGVILNLYKRRECFYLWATTNLVWSIYDFKIGAKAQGALFLVYFALSIWGIIKWKKNEKELSFIFRSMFK